MTTTALSPRQMLMLSLANDLDIQGWNQNNRLWTLNGQASDEWLVYFGEFSKAPEEYLVDLISAPEDGKPDGTGLLVATEGWEYPASVREGFATVDAQRAMWRSVPPNKHPERVEIRHLLLICQDGEVLGLSVSNETTPLIKWARLEPTTPCPTGDRTIDAARALLGLHDKLVERVRQWEGLQALANVASVLELAMSGQATQDEIVRELFLGLPDSVKAQVVQEMPDDLKDEVRAVLTEEERRRWGL